MENNININNYCGKTTDKNVNPDYLAFQDKNEKL